MVNKKLRFCSILVLGILCCVLSFQGMRLVSNFALNPNKKIVLIDPGHGGSDPGKVGINDVLEKDINLSISLKLKTLLKKNDIEVIMTRDIDKGLYTADDSNKKNADLRRRREQISKMTPDVAVSIHQNSFPSEKEKGAQVFYYKSSESSKELATFLQNQMVTQLDPNNHRQIKENDTYYLLKTNSCPMVIVECGFLSNYEEANLLKDDNYQSKVAYSIHLGILQYLNSSK